MLAEVEGRALVSGLVGRIWTLRRDYPELRRPDEFRDWCDLRHRAGRLRQLDRGSPTGGRELHAEVRVEAIGAQGRVGVAAVRPLVRAFGIARSAADEIDLDGPKAARSNFSATNGHLRAFRRGSGLMSSA